MDRQEESEMLCAVKRLRGLKVEVKAALDDRDARIAALEAENRQLLRAIPGADTTAQFLNMAEALWNQAGHVGDVEAENERLRAKLAATDDAANIFDKAQAYWGNRAGELIKKNERLREGMVRLAEEWDYLELQTTNVARFKAFAEGEKP